MIAAARPRLVRDPANAMLGGVCAGLASRTGMRPLTLRLLFVGATALAGLGAVAYALLWALTPADPAAERPRAGQRASLQAAAGVALLGLAALLVLREQGLWPDDALLVAPLLAAVGVALLWPRPGGAGGQSPGVYRGGFGVALVLGAGLIYLQGNEGLGGARDVLLGAAVVVVGLGLVLAPLLWSTARRIAAERAALARAQERAEMAAHLHDSVLQTLALVQKRAGDPQTVALLRRQERELRDWLAGHPERRPETRLADALQQTATEVEQRHGVQVDLVTVGDAELDDRGRALIAAAREAITNAAKFAPGAPIAVYAEAGEGGVQVFVRDRGPGFALERVPADRRGVRESILGRMRRHGGRAELRSGPDGTEVELAMPDPEPEP